MTLGRILRFVTCSEEVPILPYRIAPSIVFESLQYDLPTAHTCINRLCLNVPDATLPKEEFFVKFDMPFCQDYFGLSERGVLTDRNVLK